MSYITGNKLYAREADKSLKYFFTHCQNPNTGLIYGLVTRSGDADIVRVSAAGDAYLLFTVTIPTMAGIAFDTTGILYGITSSGDIHTIDLINGSITFVITGEGSY